jgi:hypothetical protein
VCGGGGGFGGGALWGGLGGRRGRGQGGRGEGQGFWGEGGAGRCASSATVARHRLEEWVHLKAASCKLSQPFSERCILMMLAVMLAVTDQDVDCVSWQNQNYADWTTALGGTRGRNPGPCNCPPPPGHRDVITGGCSREGAGGWGGGTALKGRVA